MAADRQRLIRIIHVAKRELAMDDDTYRSILRQIGNASSAADMDASKLQAVLDHLKKCGFKVRPNRRPSRPLADDPESKKIRALWLFMHNDLGVVRDPSERALAAYVKRITKVDALQWTRGDQSLMVIESLKKWAMRYLPNKIKALMAASNALPMTKIEHLHLQESVNAAFTRMSYDPMLAAWDVLQRLQRKYQGGSSE